MTVFIPRKNIFYAFSGSLSPVKTVQQGEEFILETFDCFEGQTARRGGERGRFNPFPRVGSRYYFSFCPVAMETTYSK